MALSALTLSKLESFQRAEQHSWTGLPLQSAYILDSMKHAYRVSLLLASVAMVVSPTSIAQTLQSAVGQWALQLGNRTFLVMSLYPSAGQSGPVTGTLSRPTQFQTADAVSFSHVEGPTDIEPVIASQWKGNSLAITVQNPKGASDRSEYLLTIKDETGAELRMEGVPIGRAILERQSPPQVLQKSRIKLRSRTLRNLNADSVWMSRVEQEVRGIGQNG